MCYWLNLTIYKLITSIKKPTQMVGFQAIV